MLEFLWISLHKKWSFPLSRKERVEKGYIRNKWVKAAARGCSKDSIMKDYFGRNMSIYIEPYSGWAFSGLLTDGGGVQKGPPSLKSVTYILLRWNLAQLYLTQWRSKKYMNHVTHPWSSADISIFSPEISKFCYIKKYRYRLYVDT